MSQPSAIVMDLYQWCAANNATPRCLPPSELHCHPRHITTDSREIPVDGVYVPLQGEHFDGHAFITESLSTGARLAFCQKNIYAEHADDPAWQNLPLILVENTLQAFQSLAHSWRQQLNTPVIAITGSSGKTSTKEILKQVFARDFNVHATPENWNNEIGVPKTLLMLTPAHDLCLIEMGMRGLGQIQELCEIAAPDYGVITNIGPVHLGELGSQAAIVRAKWELAEYLFSHAKASPCLVINSDNAFLQQQYESLSTSQQQQVARIGQSEHNDLQLLESITHTSEAQVSTQHLRYQFRGTPPHAIALDLLGMHQALNLLSGLMLLSILNKPPLGEQTLSVPRLSGRQEHHQLPRGGRLINDSYNANPDSMRAAIGALKQLPGPHIAVLGLMGELGPDSENYHRQLGSYCAEQHLKHVVVVGEGASAIMQGLSASQGTFCKDARAAVEVLSSLHEAHPRASFLIKASRSAHLEEVVSEFLTVLPCQT